MYNSTLKYYAKALLGRKNDMWYFDKLQRSYPKRDQKLVKELLSLTDSNLLTNSFLSRKNNLQLNPLYEAGKKLRDACLAEYENKFLRSPYNVFIHLPPLTVSP